MVFSQKNYITDMEDESDFYTQTDSNAYLLCLVHKILCEIMYLYYIIIIKEKYSLDNCYDSRKITEVLALLKNDVIEQELTQQFKSKDDAEHIFNPNIENIIGDICSYAITSLITADVRLNPNPCQRVSEKDLEQVEELSKQIQLKEAELHETTKSIEEMQKLLLEVIKGFTSDISGK